MAEVIIRPAVAEDAAVIVEMIHELAASEGYTGYARTSVDSVLTHGFGAEPAFYVLLAERGGAAVGYASYMRQYSIWAAGECLGLDDLYVRPEARGAGVGLALMRAFAAECVLRGAYGRWGVRQENDRALAFYEQLGATLTSTRVCTWSEEAMRQVLASSPGE